MTETLNLQSNQEQLDNLTEEMWDLRDKLRKVELARAALMNVMKEETDETNSQ